MANTTKKEKGKNLSLYEKVYRELDSTFIGAERQRNVPAGRKERYDYMDLGVRTENNRDLIVIKAETAQRLDFAEKVAKYYGVPYTRLEESWRRDPAERFIIKIDITE